LHVQYIDGFCQKPFITSLFASLLLFTYLHFTSKFLLSSHKIRRFISSSFNLIKFLPIFALYRSLLLYLHVSIVTQGLLHLFIHSGHFYSAPLNPLLLRGAPDYSTDTVSEFHAKAHKQLYR